MVQAGRATWSRPRGPRWWGRAAWCSSRPGRRTSSPTSPRTWLWSWSSPRRTDRGRNYWPERTTAAASRMPRRASVFGALVTRIARVPLHPQPGDLVAAHRLVSACATGPSFLTGFLAEVIQPLRCQPLIHLVIPSSRYLLSVCRSTLACRLQRLKRLDGRHQLHPVVRGQRIAAVHLLLRILPAEHRAPPARSPGCRCTRRLCIYMMTSGHARKVTPCRAPVTQPRRRFGGDLLWTPRVRMVKGTVTRGGAVR